ncbi:hypothetical protein SF123566_7697 [Shigella flexneri 1235-66]|nr:hypothetical protein SF123566_7697 [Shigella flexneri 1235-66]
MFIKNRLKTANHYREHDFIKIKTPEKYLLPMLTLSRLH